MANNTIQVTYKVNDDGSLEKLSQKAKKAAAATDEVATSSDKYNKVQKGVINNNLAGAKSFSKMSNAVGSGGLVGAYATIAASVLHLQPYLVHYKKLLKYSN